MVHNQTYVSLISIVIGECTVLLLLIYGIIVCAVLIDFWSYYLIFFIRLRFINSKKQTTTPFSSLWPLSRVIVLWCTTKYSFFVCVTSFDFYSTHYKVYVHIPFFNTQKQKASPFNITRILLHSDRRMLILYQGSANHCEGHRNSDVIRLIQPPLKINYCNQSVLFVPDLNIILWSITIFYLISRSNLVQYFFI